MSQPRFLGEHERIHAALGLWLDEVETLHKIGNDLLDSESETIPGLQWTSRKQSQELTPTLIDPESPSKESGLTCVPPMPAWAAEWAAELTQDFYSTQASQVEATQAHPPNAHRTILPHHPVLAPDDVGLSPPLKKAKCTKPVPVNRSLSALLGQPQNDQVLPPLSPCLSAVRGPEPEPLWIAETKDKAEAAVQSFVALTNRVFSSGASRSVKFTCLIMQTNALEVAQRLKWFMGKDKPPVPIELLAEPGKWQPPVDQIHITAGGNESNTVLRVHFPRKMLGRGTKGCCASVQINMARGQPGARPVTVQGTKQCFHQFQTSWIMCLGPMEYRDTQTKLNVDAFMWVSSWCMSFKMFSACAPWLFTRG